LVLLLWRRVLLVLLLWLLLVLLLWLALRLALALLVLLWLLLVLRRGRRGRCHGIRDDIRLELTLRTTMSRVTIGDTSAVAQRHSQLATRLVRAEDNEFWQALDTEGTVLVEELTLAVGGVVDVVVLLPLCREASEWTPVVVPPTVLGGGQDEKGER